MAIRKSVPKRVRFEVFKRDGFCCVYCGSHPPEAILHIDHLVPVAEGGTNDIDNLATACSVCNIGKGAIPLTATPQSLAERALEVAEREQQLRGYAEIMEAARQRRESDIDRVAEVFEELWNDGMTLSDSARMSVRRFVDQLGVHEVLEAAEIAAASRALPKKAFKYFCGVCWNKIRERA